jgi:hypothetical protein
VQLQASALDLLDRMIAVHRVDVPIIPERVAQFAGAVEGWSVADTLQYTGALGPSA